MSRGGSRVAQHSRLPVRPTRQRSGAAARRSGSGWRGCQCPAAVAERAVRHVGDAAPRSRNASHTMLPLRELDTRRAQKGTSSATAIGWGCSLRHDGSELCTRESAAVMRASGKQARLGVSGELSSPDHAAARVSTTRSRVAVSRASSAMSDPITASDCVASSRTRASACASRRASVSSATRAHVAQQSRGVAYHVPCALLQGADQVVDAVRRADDCIEVPPTSCHVGRRRRT